MQPGSSLLFSARAEIESPTLRHDPRRTDDELARSNSSGLSGTCARLFPLYPFPACSTCVARFTLGVIHVLAVFMSLLRNLPSVSVRPIRTPIFTKVLTTAPTRDLRSFNFQCFPLRKKMSGESRWHRHC